MRWFKRLSIGVGLLLVTAVSTAACPGREQLSSGTTEFEVASIKPTSNADGRALLQATPGQLAMTNLVLRRIILIAYNIQDDQLAGGPDWIDSADYDIQAKADGSPSVQQMEGPMLRSLLQERFKLTLHRETRQLPVYKLSVARNGPRLQPTKEGGCIPYATDAAPPIATTGELHPNYCGLHTVVNGLNRALDGRGVTMPALASSLSRAYTAALGRNVVDGTELAGGYDIHLEWALDRPSAVPDNAGNPTPSDLQGPSIFTALQEQLGLRLEPTRGPVEVVVIDHIEKPSEN